MTKTEQQIFDAAYATAVRECVDPAPIAIRALAEYRIHSGMARMGVPYVEIPMGRSISEFCNTHTLPFYTKANGTFYLRQSKDSSVEEIEVG